MHTTYFFHITFVPLDHQASPDVDAGLLAMPWAEDESPSAVDALRTRNHEIVARLGRYYTGTARLADWHAELEMLNADDPSADTLLLREHRAIAASIPWQFGDLVLEIYDRFAFANVAIQGYRPADESTFEYDLRTLLRAVSDSTGFLPWNPTQEQIGSIDETVQFLMSTNRRGLKRFSLRNRILRWKRRAGWPSLILMTILAFGLVATIVGAGVSRGTIAARSDAEPIFTFVTQHVLPTEQVFGVFPRYALSGYLMENSQQVRLRVSRDEVIRAGVGALYTVIAQHDADEPYVLRSRLDSVGAFVRLGDYGVSAIAAFALLPLALWYWFLARPWSRFDESNRGALQVRTTEMLLTLGKIATLLAALILARWFL